ncbi:MAG: transporter [Chthoniobacter sp.]|nr:transporter [Chthoniobacter sp.]
MIHPSVKIALLSLASASAVAASETVAAPTTRLPETTSTAFTSVLSEDTPIGETGRPEWTSARRFTGTRVYIQQEPWEVGVESWWRLKNHYDGTESHRLLEEVEIGLPYRMQLDLYQDIEGDQKGHFHYQSFNVELRYALADWGKIWGNPTFYGEYKIADHQWGPDVYELKLLLGDQFLQRWHWGVNFVWEAETGGDREYEFQIPVGLSYSVIDGKLGVGVEVLYDHDTIKGERGHPAHQFNIGPSIQWRPTPRVHIDLSCQWGTNNSSDREIGWLIVGYDFGRLGHSERAYTPVSGRQN